MAPEFKISEFDKAQVGSILQKLEKLKGQTKDEIVLLNFNQLYSLCSETEYNFLDRFLAINPRDFGFTGPFLGIETQPSADLVAIENQHFQREKSGTLANIEIATQYLPRRVFKAYSAMNQTLQQDLGRILLVESGYRSSAYQVFTLLYHLDKFEFDLSRTLGLVAFPGFSQHGYPPNQAIDFITESGIPSDTNPELFAQTREYSWLLKHAQQFKFRLSYPKDNPDGIVFEPWHWSYRQN